MKLAELILEDKSSPYADWFVELPVDVAVKATTATLRMQPGNLLSTEWFGGISKFKLNVGAGWRIYFAKNGLEIVILLGGGSKRSQQKDIDRAVSFWNDYKQRKQSLAKAAKLAEKVEQKG